MDKQLAAGLCMGNTYFISWSAADRFFGLADKENHRGENKKQLSWLVIWRIMDAGMDMYDLTCYEHGKRRPLPGRNPTHSNPGITNNK